jgi:predicted AAA+ superfamily ATPase
VIRRDIQKELLECSREYPVVCLTGPRQSGKTTLARTAFAKHRYVTFEDPIGRSYFIEDPVGFLEQHRDGAVFDEVQHVPELFSHLQGLVDEDPVAGRFVLTGSQHFGMTERITQSLAGRAAILELLPFSVDELRRGRFLADNLNGAMWNGCYPPVHDRGLKPERWYRNYVATYVQRDVRQISQVHDLDLFTRFMRLCAGSVGQLLNNSRLATELGVDSKTVRSWISVLQASYILQLLPPFHRNFRKRVVKTPKLYFFDTGLVCHLLGIQEPGQLGEHPLRGALFENLVFDELAKSLVNQGEPAQLYFWRTQGGQEVDFVVETGDTVLSVECKSGMTVKTDVVASMEHTIAHWKGTPVRLSVVYGGGRTTRIRDCSIVPWSRISRLLG